MKKYLLTLAVALVAAPLAFAQQGGWETGLSLGSCLYDRSQGHSEIGIRSNSETNGHVAEYSPTLLPTFVATAGYNFADAPFGVFMNVGWNYAWNTLKGGPSPLKEQEHILHFTPEVRLYYVQNPKFRMYATVGADLRYRSYTEQYRSSKCSNADISFGYQLSPLGFSFGDRWVVSMDFGFGTLWSAVSIGAGYRF